MPLTASDKARVRKMRAAGYKVRLLAYLFGVHRQTITAACRDHGKPKGERREKEKSHG